MLTCDWLCRNAPDFASRARTPAAAGLPQLISVPLGFSLVSFFGIIVSSSSQAIYGEAIWSPIDLLGKFLDGEPSHATRFGVWFIAASFIIAQVRVIYLRYAWRVLTQRDWCSLAQTSLRTRLARAAT